MTLKRTSNNNYSNFSYTSEVNKLLNVTLNKRDESKLKQVYANFNNLESSRSYEPIIKDLYILTEKHHLTTKQLSEIYKIGVRSIQKWLKELGLNRSIAKAHKVTNKSTVNKKNINIELLGANVSDVPRINKFGIEIEEKENLPMLVKDFLNYLETIKGKSINTINAYKTDLSVFFKFIKVYKGYQLDDNIQFIDIPIDDINSDFIKSIKLTDMYAFLSYAEKQRNNSNYARARKVATLKSFYNYLHNKAKVIQFNAAAELESPKINERHPIYLTLDQSIELLDSLDKSNKNYERDYCILVFFLNCGLRVSELCSIEINKIKSDTLTIIGKGNKERTIYLNSVCIKALEQYLSVRDDSKAISKNKNYLFLSARNTPINKRTVEILVKKHISNAGFTNAKYTPHKLRHTAATLMYKHGNVDIRSLQNILGHESISTTQIYTHVDEEQLRDAVNSNPLSNL